MLYKLIPHTSDIFFYIFACLISIDYLFYYFSIRYFSHLLFAFLFVAEQWYFFQRVLQHFFLTNLLFYLYFVCKQRKMRVSRFMATNNMKHIKVVFLIVRQLCKVGRAAVIKDSFKMIGVRCRKYFLCMYQKCYRNKSLFRSFLLYDKAV